MGDRLSLFERILSEGHERFELNAIKVDSRDFIKDDQFDVLWERILQMGWKGGEEIHFEVMMLESSKGWIKLDEELDFNRYRRAFFQVKPYPNRDFFEHQAHLAFCRNKELECKKKGLGWGFWTNDMAESLFGKGAEPGDLGNVGNGAPEWKWRAVRNTLLDLFAFQKELEFKRISIFDPVFFSGKLQAFHTLLKPGCENVLNQFLLRKWEKRSLEA